MICCAMVFRIKKVLKSYFYNDSVTYRLDELIAWVEREFACAWMELPIGTVNRILGLSQEYEVCPQQASIAPAAGPIVFRIITAK